MPLGHFPSTHSLNITTIHRSSCSASKLDGMGLTYSRGYRVGSLSSDLGMLKERVSSGPVLIALPQL